MADNLQNYMRMSNIFNPQQQQQPQFTEDIFAPQQQQMPVIPSNSYPQQMPMPVVPSRQIQQNLPPSTIPSRQFPQLASQALMPTAEPRDTAWDQFQQSVMNPPKREHMTYPDSTLNVYNEALKLASEPTAYDKNRVYVDGKAFQKQKAFIDPATGEQKFLTDVKKPGFFDNTLKAMSAGGTSATDLLNQPYKDAEQDWKLRTEGLKTVATAEANQALAQQRVAQANIGIPGQTGARVMDAQTRARVAALKDLPDSEKLRLLQEGKVTIAEINAAASMDRVNAQQAGAMERVGAQQAGATERTGMQQAGATERTGMQQAGANQRMDQSQAGQDRRSQASIAGAMERTNAQQAGASSRTQATIAARAAAGRAGGISESQGKVAQQRIANELIDEMPELEQYITYDQNGFPLISEDLEPADRQFILDEFSSRLGKAPSSVGGTTPKLPPPPPVRKAPPATIPQPGPARGTPPPNAPPQAAQQKAGPASGKVRVIRPDGVHGTWDYSKGAIPNGWKLEGK